MTEKVIIFNGAPGSGKDTFADMLQEHFCDTDGLPFINRESFKYTLLLLTKAFYNIGETEWNSRYENQKEVPWDKLGGLSQREALIDMSENKIKPTLGKDFFGKAAAQQCYSMPWDKDDIYAFSDGGFKEELMPLIEKFGTENILVLRLHREGHTFKGDSRGLLKESDFNGDVLMIDIESDDIQQTFNRVLKEVLAWTNG